MTYFVYQKAGGEGGRGGEVFYIFDIHPEEKGVQ